MGKGEFTGNHPELVSEYEAVIFKRRTGVAKNLTMRILIASGMFASTMVPGTASAVDWNITGFVRQEVSVRTTDQGNVTNGYQNHDNANNRINPGFGGLGGANGVTPLNNNNISSGTLSYDARPGAGFGGCGPVGGPPGTNVCDRNADGINDFAGDLSGEVPFNMFNTRAELEIQAKFNESVAAYMRVRAYFDGSSIFADDNVRIGKHFKTDAGFGGNRGNLLELQNDDAMIDIPSLYADINFGSAWFRVGQQQIAWGEALFFRVFDIANGLDLRRHLFFDVGAEEYADERVASPGVRGSYTFSNGWEVDAFVQMFSPTIYPNSNTPYNVILDGFTVSNSRFGKGFDDAENTLNVGARVIMPDLFVKDLTLSVMAANRRNPDGVFRWDEGGGGFLNKNATFGVNGENPFCNGTSRVGGNTINGGGGNIVDSLGRDTGTRGDQDTNCGHSFELGSGTSSYQEWWQEASFSRFDPVQAAATSIAELSGSDQLAKDFGIGRMADGKFDFVTQAQIETFNVDGPLTPAQQTALTTITAAEVAATVLCTSTSTCTRNSGKARKLRGMRTVEGFFTGFGPLRGHISREYKRENILGVSFNYIITADPTSLFDQLIVRGEMSYTIDKSFTDISASTQFTESDEILASVILEKYQSLFDALPATYFVFEWMHRTDTDLGGRLLSGYSTEGDMVTEDPDGSPSGVGSANYFVFAFQQPFPNLIWRADFAMLADVRGGLFLQPGLRFKPSGEWQFDMYANIAADVGGKNDDMLETFDSMDEVFVRASYYF